MTGSESKTEARCKLKVGAGAAVVLAVFGLSLLTRYGREHMVTVVWLVVASSVHEWGHFLMARLVGVPLVEFRLGLLGARFRTEGSMTYEQEWWLSAGGPLMNFLTALPVLFFWCSGHLSPPFFEGAATFLSLSLGLGVLNLLPIETFDGGRMLYCFLALFVGESTALRVTQWISFGCVTLLWMLSAYVLLRVGRSLSIFVFSAVLLYRGLMGTKEV